MKPQRLTHWVTHPGNEDAAEVIQVATSWFPPDVVDACPVLAEHKTGAGGSKSRLAEEGFKQVRLREEVEFLPLFPESRGRPFTH